MIELTKRQEKIIENHILELEANNFYGINKELVNQTGDQVMINSFFNEELGIDLINVPERIRVYSEIYKQFRNTNYEVLNTGYNIYANIPINTKSNDTMARVHSTQTDLSKLIIEFPSVTLNDLPRGFYRDVVSQLCRPSSINIITAFDQTLVLAVEYGVMCDMNTNIIDIVEEIHNKEYELNNFIKRLYEEAKNYKGPIARAIDKCLEDAPKCVKVNDDISYVCTATTGPNS